MFGDYRLFETIVEAMDFLPRKKMDMHINLQLISGISRTPPPQELIHELLELENPWFHFLSNSFDSNSFPRKSEIERTIFATSYLNQASWINNYEKLYLQAKS